MSLTLVLLDGHGPLTTDDLSRAGAQLDVEATDAVTAVLDELAVVLRDDPGFAGRVLERVAQSLDDLCTPELAPSVAYLLAQVRVREGQLAAALGLIERAHAGHLANGNVVQAARTNLGRAGVLNDMGRYDDAVGASDDLIAVVEQLHGHIEPVVAHRLLARGHHNRGNAQGRAGRLAESLASYDQAEAHLRYCDDGETLADLVFDRAELLMNAGNVGRGTAEFERAATVYATEGARMWSAVAFTCVARGHVEMGESAEALAVLGRAGALLETIEAEQWRYEHAAVRADAYLSLNLLHEAIDEYRGIQKWISQTDFAIERARTSYAIGRALARLGDVEAADVLAEAVCEFRELGDAGAVARSLVALGTHAGALGAHDRARSALSEAIELARSSGMPLELVRARVAFAAITAPDLAACELLHRDAIELGVPPLIRDAAHIAGRCALASADVAEARKYLDEAASIDESRRLTLGHERLLVGFGAGTDDLLSDRVRVELAGGATGAVTALAVADAGKSRSLFDLAAGVADRRSNSDSADGEISRELHAAYRQMFDASGDVDRFAEHRRRAAELETQLARRALARIDRPRRTSRHADGVARDVDDVDDNDVGDDLLPEVAYCCLGDDIVAFVRRGDRVEVARLDTDVPTVCSLLARLDAQHGRLRLGDDFAVRNAARLEVACRSVLGALYDAVFAPVARILGAVPDDGGLVVAPHGPLHGVPFHALWDGAEHLVDRWTISVAPSLAIYKRCARRARGSTARPLVVGIGDDLAPRALHEADAVATLTGADVLLGDDATFERVQSACAGRALVHIASHAWHRSDNPMFSAIRLADRWLTAGDVLNDFDLEGATVVLSACDTGRGTAVGGDELLGLTRGFLGAGAASLVASLWPANDAATDTMMRTFHEQLAHVGPARALRAAQIRCKAAHAHPSLWAPFTLVGAR